MNAKSTVKVGNHTPFRGPRGGPSLLKAKEQRFPAAEVAVTQTPEAVVVSGPLGSAIVSYFY